MLSEGNLGPRDLRPYGPVPNLCCGGVRQLQIAVARTVHLFEHGIRWAGREANLDLPVPDHPMQLNDPFEFPRGNLEPTQ